MANLNVKDAAPADLAAFNKIKADHPDLTSKDVLAMLVKRFTEQSGNSGGFTDQDYQNIQQELTRITEENQQVTAQLQQANERITELENQLAASTGKPQLTYPQFICNPAGKLVDLMRAIRPKFYADGFTTNEEKELYPNELANYAIRYFAANQYPKHYKTFYGNE